MSLGRRHNADWQIVPFVVPVGSFGESLMRFWMLSIVGLTVALAGLPAGAGDFQIGTHTFTLPDGFEIEQVAGPPLVDRPIVCDF
jgi:TctA family transporter